MLCLLRSTFELARVYGEVIGIDLSQTFIDMANKMKQEGQVAYDLTVEGDISQQVVAQLDNSISKQRCAFLQVCMTTATGAGPCVFPHVVFNAIPHVIPHVIPRVIPHEIPHGTHKL